MTLYSDPSKTLNALQGFIKKHLMDSSSHFLCPGQLPSKKMHFVQMLLGRYTVSCYNQMFVESKFILDPVLPPCTLKISFICLFLFRGRDPRKIFFD